MSTGWDADCATNTPCRTDTGGFIAKNGYRIIDTNRKLSYAHRNAWIKEHGPIPKGMDVCHRCDNRACDNIDHPFLGTRGQNLRDMAAKGRGRNQKLTPGVVSNIKQLLTDGASQRAVARQCGISQRLVFNVNAGLKDHIDAENYRRAP